MAKIPMINFNSPDKRAEILQYYIEVFNEIPSGNHMVRAYTQMEKIFLEKYAAAKLSLDGEVLIKSLEKFEKLKSLALANANINERKLAFYKSIELYIKITEVKLTIPKEFGLGSNGKDA